MNWFRKQSSIEDGAVKAPPPGEAEAVQEIRAWCNEAGDSAKNVGSDNFPPDDEFLKMEKDRFEAVKKKSLERAMGITDHLYRDAAMHSVIDLCIKAQDLRTAKVLLGGIHTQMIADKIRMTHRWIR
jgi:hypothetical protein